MKRSCIFIFFLFCALPVHSISSFKASYDLYGKTDLGNIRLGSAEYELIVANNSYVFTSNAKTDKLWSAIYNYMISETSIGLIEDNNLISDYYKIVENQGDSFSDSYEINIYPNERYATLNNEILNSNDSKNSISKLSDSELIIKAIGTGNYSKIEFKGSDAHNPDIPSYDKDLANRDELIELITKSLKEINFNEIVDALSIYLHISRDIQKYPNRNTFVYQIVDKKGLNQREFFIEGLENIKINNEEVETTRISCPKLRLIFNISKNHNFMPVHIRKKNGGASYKLTLTNYH